MQEMYYRIKFKAAPEEFVFEVLRAKKFEIVRDVIRTVKDNFKIQSDVLVLDENCRVLTETEPIHARIYIVKRIPSKITNRKKKAMVKL